VKAWWWIPGILIFSIGLYCLLRDIPPWNVVWYAFGWYGYLLVLDAVIYRIQGHSFLTHRRIELLEMFFWSIPFWFLFEAYNFVLDNWYYVYALNSNFSQGIFAFVAFATVLPACFFHAEFLKSIGAFRNASLPPINIHRGLKQFFFWFGLLCIILPLLLPRYTFWMVWGATLGVPDYVNYRNGAPSLLGDLEEGNPRRLYRLLAGGFLAGIVWEGLNYWARCKWIYTVPGLEEWKLFEMPVLGFLGFPVLALEAFAFYTMLSWYVRGGRSWEIPDGLQLGRFRSPWYGRVALVGIGFSLIVYFGIIDETLTSRRVQFSQLNPLGMEVKSQLADAGIRAPEQVYRYVEANGAKQLSSETGVPVLQLQETHQLMSLALHKGMGVMNARLLKEIGISRVSDLVDKKAQTLYRHLQEAAITENVQPPTLPEIHIWIRAARFGGDTKR